MGKKKIIIIVLAVLVVIGIAGTNKSKQDSEKEITNVSGSDTSGEVTSGEIVSVQSGSSEQEKIDQKVLVDKNGIKITAVEYVSDSIWGEGIKLLLENTTEKNYTVGCDALIVNDYMITDLFASTIAAGKKANETLYLYSSQLEAAGIENVGKIEMYFHAYDDNMDYAFRDAYAEVQTSLYAKMDSVPNDMGMELYNANGIRIVGKKVDENSFWGSAILLYCENTSDKNMTISVDDMSINGFMMNPLFSTTVYANKKAINDITVFSSDLEENGISSIDTVELKFKIHETGKYSNMITTDPITFSTK